MSKEFVASNGLKVVERYDGERLYLYDGDGENLMKNWDFIGVRDTVALAEYYRAKEDERLGRWRWPENPDYVVYPKPDEAFERMFGPGLDLVILRESDGMTKGYVREEDQGGPPMAHRVDHVLAARAYFNAHPEPKLWHDAAEGEVWELEFKAGTHAWFVNGLYFQSTKTLTNIYKTDPDILSARKIWPQDD